jgi:hypothetical protein
LIDERSEERRHDAARRDDLLKQQHFDQAHRQAAPNERTRQAPLNEASSYDRQKRSLSDTWQRWEWRIAHAHLVFACGFCVIFALLAFRPPRQRGVENTTPSLVLGLFGLSQQTTEKDLTDLFSQYGEIDRLTLIYDKATGTSRGFGFMSVGKRKRESRRLKCQAPAVAARWTHC